MIDVENEIFSPVAEALRAAFPGIYVTSHPYSGIPQEIPCVYLSEESNTSDKSTIDSSGLEKYVNLVFKADVFSNKAAGAKSQCKAIMGFLGDLLFSVNFVRTANKPESPLSGGKIFWQSARFEAETDGERMFRKY